MHLTNIDRNKGTQPRPERCQQSKAAGRAMLVIESQIHREIKKSPAGKVADTTRLMILCLIAACFYDFYPTYVYVYTYLYLLVAVLGDGK